MGLPLSGLTPQIQSKIQNMLASSSNGTYDSKAAERVISNRNAINKKITGNKHFNELIDDVNNMIDMIKDYYDGKYKEASTKTVMTSVAALSYLTSAVDLIPDAIPVIGLADDAFVINLCKKMINTDYEAYLAWKKAQEEAAKAAKNPQTPEQ